MQKYKRYIFALSYIKCKIMWKYYALLSAVFASLTAIFAKIGIKGVNSDLATAIRTTIILLLTWGIVFFSGVEDRIKDIGLQSWVFIILSGIATGCSWLFYFKALQIGCASRVAPTDKLSVPITICLSFLILREPVNFKTIIGGLLITGGSIILLLK